MEAIGTTLRRIQPRSTNDQQEVLKSLEQVQLSEEELNEVIIQAKLKKQLRLEHEAKVEARLNAEKEALRVWTAEEMFEIVSKNALQTITGWQMDEMIKSTLFDLCLYFTADKRFSGELEKGIMLAGNVGVGKTVMMWLVSKNKRRCFEIIPCKRITDDFMDDGIEMLYKFYQPLRALSGTFEYFLQNEMGVCFDDLGTETVPCKHMGNEVNVMERIILTRYDKRVPFHYTHFTTNLTWDELGKVYGSRAMSRLNQMVNVLELSGSDKRK